MGGISVLFILGILMSMYVIFVGILVVAVIYILVNYIFESIFLYKVSKKLKYKYSITSWIPFYNKCILGKIANRKTQGITIFIINLIIIALIVVSYFSTNFSDTVNMTIFLSIIILMIVNFILNIIISHNIIKKVIPKFVDFLTLLNVFTFGFSRAIILFIIRNNDKLLDGE